MNDMKHELKGILAFVKVAETACFTKAAEVLHISQPALTRRIKKLEESLGTPLFERSTRQVKLTTIGQTFLHHARDLLDFYDNSINSIKELTRHIQGCVTISCLPTAAFYFLPSVIRDYNQKYPNIRIRLLEHSANDCLDAVLSGEADFGINMSNITHSSVSFTPLINEPFVLACRHDHPLAQKQLISWEELEDHALIGVRESSGNRLLIEEELAQSNWQPNWFYEVRHLSTSLGMVEAGLGVAPVPSLAMPTGEHHALTSRPLVDPVIRRTLGIVLRKYAILSPAAEHFHRMLLDLWSNENNPPWIYIGK